MHKACSQARALEQRACAVWNTAAAFKCVLLTVSLGIPAVTIQH